MRKLALIALILVFAMAGSVLSDVPANALVDSSATKKTQTSEEGIMTTELLPGNGTRAGYMLGHGNLITESEWVSIGAKRAARNRDYTIDYESGMLFFTEPVSTMNTVQVDYRYSAKGGAERKQATPSMMAMKFGSGLQTNMMYSLRAAESTPGLNGQDVLTYGLSNISKFGASSNSSLSGMFYVTSPQASNRVTLNATGAPVNTTETQIKRDHLIVQDADLQAGKFRLKLGYQDVGQDFVGFSSLKDSKVTAADALNQLEKEKGVRRMSVAGEGQGLNFAVNRISDKGDEILSRNIGYKTDTFAFAYNARNVGRQFDHFKEIREADRAQMAAEQGMNRQSFSMQFRTAVSVDKKAIWSGVNFTDLSDGGADLSYRQADIQVGGVQIQADVRSSDPNFNRLSALTDEERSRMALMARRQFDPSASQVTAEDKAQIANEAGLDRSTYVVQIDAGRIDTWMSMSNVDSQKGGLTRRAFGLKGNGFSAYFDSQNIDSKFDKLAALQPIEKTHYGNEFGMSRTELGGMLKLMKSDVTLDTANVVDNAGAGFHREKFAVKNSKLNFVANFQDIDAGFSRIMDLSNPDREKLTQDRGFRRADYAIKFQPIKTLAFDSYLYDSTNVTAGQTRGQNRHKVAYAPVGGPKVNFLTDDFSYIAESGNIASYFHREVKFDHSFNVLGGLAVKGRNDIYTTEEGDLGPQTTTVFENHIESNPKARTSFTADVVNIDYGGGKYDNTHSVGFKTAAVRSLSLVSGYSTTARDSGNSETNSLVGFEWDARKDLKMTFSTASRDGGPKGNQNSSSFSLNGLLAKRLALLNDVTIASAMNHTSLRGKQTVCDDAFKIDAGLLGGKLLYDTTDKLNPKNGLYYSSTIFQYESDKDPKKPYHWTLYSQDLTTPLGVRTNKKNYSFDYKFASAMSMTFSSFLGKDGKNGAVIPVGGTVIKLNHNLNKATLITADYTTSTNDETFRHANVIGLGIARTVKNATSYELYYGWCALDEGTSVENKPIFRLKYDTKLRADNYLSLSLQRKTGIEKGSINAWEGDTVGRIDFKYSFD